MAMAMVQVDRADGVVTVTLENPGRKNAVTLGMWHELLEVLDQVRNTSTDRVLVVTGAGGDFCSGADVSALQELEDHPVNLMRITADVALALHRLQKPTIAKVRGVAAGAGCNMAIGCDLVFADDTARFAEIFSKRGLSVDFGGSWLLPRLVGVQRAKELVFSGDVIDAARAEQLGLVNAVLSAAELDDHVARWATRLAAGPPLALAFSKALLDAGGIRSMDEALEAEGAAQAVNLGSVDAAEAMAAFFERREPRFEGR